MERENALPIVTPLSLVINSLLEEFVNGFSKGLKQDKKTTHI